MFSIDLLGKDGQGTFLLSLVLVALLFGVIMVDATVFNESPNASSPLNESLTSEVIINATPLIVSNVSSDILPNESSDPVNATPRMVSIEPIIENLSNESMAEVIPVPSEGNASVDNLSLPPPAVAPIGRRNASSEPVSEAANHSSPPGRPETPANASLNHPTPPTEVPVEPIIEENSSTTGIINDSEPEVNSSLETPTIVANSSNESIATASVEPRSPQFAQTINGQSIDTPYIKQYFGWYDNFSDVEFVDVKGKWDDGYRILRPTLASKDLNGNKKGFLINNTKYVLHLIDCIRTHQNKMCTLRLNGVPITNVSITQVNEIPLKQNYVIKIDDIKFGYCDGRSVCDYYHDAYDLVKLSIDLKTGIR